MKLNLLSNSKFKLLSCFLILLVASNFVKAKPTKSNININELDFQKEILKIKGTISDNQGNLLVGVTIKNSRTENIRFSDENGNYQIDAQEGDMLLFSYIGMKNESALVGNKVSINIKMEEDAITLNDIVITGYQKLSKERATGSFSVISSEDINKKHHTNLMQRIEGMSTGLTNYKGDLKIRGIATINGNNQPLYVVDGVPYEGNLDAINPSEIANITILKDATAASIYGARSANGVIVITTKVGTQKSIVEYSGMLNISSFRDNRNYLRKMNSAELIDFKKELFDIYHTPYKSLDPRTAIDEVTELFYKKEQNLISDSEYDKLINMYKSRDNFNQIKDLFLRTAVTQQHNLAIRGGSEKYNYSASLNYTKDIPFNTYTNSDRIGYNIKSQYKFFKWLQADVSVIGSVSKYNNKGFDPTSLFYGGIAPYTMVYDESGKQIEWRKSKSRQEIDRLIALGLNDETYYPLKDRELYENLSKSTYNNVNIGLKFNIIDGLTANVRFQNEIESGKNSYYMSEDSYQMRNNINDATVINRTTGEKKLHIPEGGYINETRSDKTSYTLRAQIDYYKTFNNDKNEINAIAGAERRKVRSTSTYVEKYGYDPNSLAYKLLDENVLSSNIDGTESLSGTYRHKRNGWPDVFGDYEDRYVSFYANASYTFDRKYAATAGIRMDQSNLFGTDPKYQYRPLWSAGLSWYMKEENFLKNIDWINLLSLRATYGINGNIAKTSGPYMIVYSEGINPWTGEYSSSVLSPPNSGLKWERTNQFNLGLDFSLLEYRLNGSIEFYNKNTTDLLDNIAADPTSGWNELQMNYASLYNRGFEVRLNTRNIIAKDFEWSTTLNFSYNNNKVTKRENSLNSIYDYLEYTNVREGMPMGTLYSVRYAGLDENGAPLAYKADGTIVSSLWDLEIEDLKQEKSVLPPFSASLINNFQYKGFDLSFMFTYYGGHVMRAPMASFLTNSNIGNGTLKDTRNYWKKPEDSKDPNKSPAFMKNASTDVEYLWIAADKHIKKADYIKLREINFGYTFSGAWTKKIKLSELRVSAQINNIWYYGAQKRKFNPENWNGNSLYPSLTPLAPTTYSFGLNIKF